MEELIEKIGWKKFGIIVVVLCFILLGFALLSFANIDKKQTDVIKKKIEIEKQQSRTNSTKGGGFTDIEFKPYVTPDYQLKYPSDFTTKSAEPSKGTKNSVLFVNNNSNASIFVEVFAKPQNTYEALIKPYLLSDYEPEAQPLEFPTSVEFIPTKVEDPLIHKKIDFIEKDNSIVKITLTYSSDGIDTEIERNFVKLLISLR